MLYVYSFVVIDQCRYHCDINSHHHGNMQPAIYLSYKIIHSKKFFKSVKRSTAEEQKAVKVERLMEILQEQVKPIFTVFIAQGIDAVFNVLGMICIFVVGILGHHLPIYWLP